MPKTKPSPRSSTSSVQINVFDGTRRPLNPRTSVLFRVFDGNQKQVYVDEIRTNSLEVNKLKFWDNFGDNHTILVSADGFHQAGFTPVMLSPSARPKVDLMLLPKNGSYRFAEATWDAIRSRFPFVGSGVVDGVGRERYENLMETRADSLASLLNICTAMEQIHLPQGTPLAYLKQIKWDDSLAQDRFFAYCDIQLLEQVRTACQHGAFAPETGSGFFHPGATASWKQTQFGEANVQLTFHEEDKKTIQGVQCICVEPDIDYYKDLGAHTLLEVIPNSITHGLTNPKAVYVLRWIAGRRAQIPEFNPPYTIE